MSALRKQILLGMIQNNLNQAWEALEIGQIAMAETHLQEAFAEIQELKDGGDDELPPTQEQTALGI